MAKSTNNQQLVAVVERISEFVSPRQVRALLSSLVAIQSPSRHEHKILRFIERYLNRYNVLVRRQYLSRDRYNLVAHTGRGSPDGILLNTHVDTVPLYKGVAVGPVLRGNLLFGRGSCDAKGSVAAMVLAFLAAHRYMPEGSRPVTLSLTVGEEDSGDGIEKFIQDCGHFSFAIVGEPTDLKIVNSQSGYVELVLEAKAVKCHAFDPIADQAIMILVEALQEIDKGLRRSGSNSVHTFVRWLRGGQDDTFWYTRPTCAASILINTSPDSSIRTTIKDIRRIAAAASHRSRNVIVKARVDDWDTGVHTSRGFWGLKVLSSALRLIDQPVSTSHLPSWTDGSTLAAAGIPTVIFGPGLLKDAHTEREQVDLGHVRTAAMALALAMLMRPGK